MKIYQIRILGLFLNPLLYKSSASVHNSQIILIRHTVSVQYLIHEAHSLLGAELSHLTLHEGFQHRSLLSTYRYDTIRNQYNTKRSCRVRLAFISYLYRWDIHYYQSIVVFNLHTRALLIIESGSHIRKINIELLSYPLALFNSRFSHDDPGSRPIFLYLTQNSVICSVQCDHLCTSCYKDCSGYAISDSFTA